MVTAMRFAYADPPYPGQSWRLYGDHPHYAGEVDHVQLVGRLMDEFSDGWALSTSASALHAVLPLCPAPEPSRKNKGRYLQGTGTRVMAWTPSHRRRGALLVYGGRPRDPRDYLRDWVSCMPGGTDIAGGKPEPFCRWLFGVLGMLPDDELVDIFPGSGANGPVFTGCGSLPVTRPKRG